MKNKKGMIMAELAVALVISGVIMAISIHMFKSNDITKTPYLYSVVNNLPTINKSIMESCYQEGTCENPNTLPNSIKEYCARLADTFSTSGAIDCSTTTEGVQNFRISNGTGFNDIMTNSAWKELKASTSSSAPVLNKYIDIKIDINGAGRGANTLGDDIYSIRIFKNGDVVPTDASGTDTVANDDDTLFAYRVLLNRASGENRNIRIKEVVDARTESQVKADREGRIKLPFREKISFKKAVCISNPTLITRYFGASDNCESFELNSACNFTLDTNPYKDDTSAYCTIEPVRPKGSGIFKIFGI